MISLKMGVYGTISKDYCIVESAWFDLVDRFSHSFTQYVPNLQYKASEGATIFQPDSNTLWEH